MSGLPAIHSGQREVLLRLREGALLFTGYANSNQEPSRYPPLLVTTVRYPFKGCVARRKKKRSQSSQCRA
eukprot:SAG11_NODE_768_length_7269_cov_3.840725_3_plen_70_part_00